VVATNSPVRDHPEHVSVWTRFQPGLLRIAFQPIVSLVRGTVFGHEALARPMTQAGEPIRPDQLFAWARQTGEADILDRYVIERILAEVARWPVAPGIFINILPASLALVTDFLVHQTILPPEQIVMELVEESWAGPELMRWLSQLRRHHYRIAVDDVGAGYSSLTRLVEVRPDFAKIDLALVRHIDQDPVKFSLVEATSHFAQRTGIQLIAEGIETSAELATLRDLGIELGQGYLLGRPSWDPRTEPALALPPLTAHPTPAPEVLISSFVRMLRFGARGLGRGEGAGAALARWAAQVSGANVSALLQRVVDLDGTTRWELVGSEGFPPPEGFAPADLQLGEMVFQQSSPLVIQDLGGRPGWRSASIMAAPVRVRGQPWGILLIGYTLPDQVRPPVVEMITGLAALASILVDASALSPSATELSGEGLLMAAQALSRDATGDMAEPLHHVLLAALSLTGGHTGFIGHIRDGKLACVDPDGELFELNLASFLDPNTDDGRSCNGEALRFGTTAISDDVRTDDRMAPWRADLVSDGILSAAAVPLVTGDERVGLLQVYHSAVGALSDPQRRSRLEGLAALAAAIIAHAAAGQRARRAEERVAIVAERQRHLAECQDRTGVVAALLDGVHSLYEDGLAAVCHLGADETFQVEAARGDAASYFDRWRVSVNPSDPDGQLPLAQAHRTGRTTWIRPGWPDSWTYAPNPRRPDWRVYGFQWMVAVPIAIRGTSYGVLLVYGRRLDLDAELRRMLEDLARTAALVLAAIASAEQG